MNSIVGTSGFGGVAYPRVTSATTPYPSRRRVLLGGAAVGGLGAALTGAWASSQQGNSMPSLAGATAWLNSLALGPNSLRGHVVMVDFWTFTCINWIRTAPYQRAWSRAYRDDGLVTIGVHTPEFSFEHDLAGVRRAVRERGIDYPVAIDNNYAIWRAFNNHYWPARYVLDRDGQLRHSHFGEERYADTERVLQDLLGVDRDFVVAPALGVEARADWAQLRTPETYLGFGRSALLPLDGVARDKEFEYSAPDSLAFNNWGLEGRWSIEREKIGLHRAGGRIVFRFHARDAHLVMARAAPQPIAFQVLVDGRPPGSFHGEDTDAEGHGELRDARMYNLLRVAGDVRERVLDITFEAAGVEAYAFTFG